MRLEPVAPDATVDGQRDTELGGAFHLFADNPADNIQLLLPDVEVEFVRLNIAAS